jgi:hypothetical protein
VKRKIIYVSFVRLTDKVMRDWYIDYLLEKGAVVEYWDVVSLLREEHSESGAKDADYLRVLHRYDELTQLLRQPENRNAWYIMLVNYGGQFTRVFRLLSKFDCRMLFIAWGAMPARSAATRRRIVAMMGRPLLYSKLAFYQLKAAAWRRLRLVKPFEIVFAAGQVMLEGEQHALKVVPINLCDYDCYLRQKDCRKRQVQGRYAVFLDINLPYHTDLEICGYARIEAAGYYRSVNRFFGLLEQQYGLKVVIAAHPKGDCDAATFEGREAYRLVTADLVRHAEFVICHCSTAVSYAVLNAKPLVFIYTNGMLQAYRDNFMKSVRCCADYLGAPLYNVDSVHEARQVVVRDPDPSRYASYKYDFLTTRQTEHSSNGEILWRELSGC